MATEILGSNEKKIAVVKLSEVSSIHIMLKQFEKVVVATDHKVVETIKHAEKIVVEPVRRGAAHRFPTLFLILATLGASAVFYSAERFFEMWPVTANRPWLILIIGVGILAITGTLHKKLK